MHANLRSLALAALVPAVIAAGCGSSANTSAKSTPATPANTTTTQYHAGERCHANQAVVYAGKGFKCVNGKLRHKSGGAPPTTTHKTHTTKAAPQGY